MNNRKYYQNDPVINLPLKELLMERQEEANKTIKRNFFLVVFVLLPAVVTLFSIIILNADRIRPVVSALIY